MLLNFSNFYSFLETRELSKYSIIIAYRQHKINSDAFFLSLNCPVKYDSKIMTAHKNISRQNVEFRVDFVEVWLFICNLICSNIYFFVILDFSILFLLFYASLTARTSFFLPTINPKSLKRSQRLEWSR